MDQPLKILLMTMGRSPLGEPRPPSRQKPTPVAPFNIITLWMPGPRVSADAAGGVVVAVVVAAAGDDGVVVVVVVFMSWV